MTKKIGFWLSIVLSFLFLSIIYKDAFFSPNKYLYTAEGDGIKNYYNYVYHVKNDTTVTQFGGMSYPYGETMFLEDSLPFLSNVVKGIAFVFPSLNNYTIGLLNILLLLSLVAGAAFMYLIFIHYAIPPLLSAISANAAAILSSQFLLLNPAGHWGLSFICFFPIGWYLLIRFFENKKQIKWSLLIAINILIWSYTHVYLGFILVLFTLVTHFFTAVFNPKIYLKNFRNYIALAVQVILPIIIIFSLVKLTDHHPDRINMPFIKEHIASFYSVFIPNFSWLKPIYELVFDLSVQQTQSWCRIGNYIGFTSNLAIITFACLMVVFTAKKQFKKIFEIIPVSLLPYLLASIVLLLYSMAIPLKYLPDTFVNSIQLIKQFSALGRFGWAFYYVMILFSVLLFYKLFSKKAWSRVVLFLLVFLYIFEGITSHMEVSANIVKHPNSFCKAHLTRDNKILAEISNKEFQGIIPIPYYFKFNLPFASSNSDSAIYGSMVASFHSGLPIFSTYLSRPSVSESMNIYKMMLPYPYTQIIPELAKDGRDLAVIVEKSDSEILNDNQKQLLLKCTIFLQSTKYTIYRLTIDSLISSSSIRNRSDYESIKSSLLNYKSLLVSDSSQFFVYRSFDSIPSAFTIKGKGSFYGLKSDYSYVYKGSTRNMDCNKDYIISFWYYNHVWDQTFNTAVISEDDSAGNNIQYLYYSPIETQIIDGWWYFSEYKFKVKSNKNILSVFFHGDNFFEKWYTIDELMIRPFDLDIYQTENNGTKEIIYKNNKKYIIQ